MTVYHDTEFIFLYFYSLFCSLLKSEVEATPVNWNRVSGQASPGSIPEVVYRLMIATSRCSV